MKREWKPGDLLTGKAGPLDYDTFFVVEVTANSRAAWGDGLHAINRDGNGYSIDVIRDKRPVPTLAINEQSIRRVIEVLREKGLDVIAGIVEEQVASPKPDEPTGLGAVVEDRWGHVFVRTNSDGGDPNVWWNADESQACTWDHVDAVKVLSAGWVA